MSSGEQSEGTAIRDVLTGQAKRDWVVERKTMIDLTAIIKEGKGDILSKLLGLIRSCWSYGVVVITQAGGSCEILPICHHVTKIRT